MGKARVDLRSVTTVGLDLAKHVFQVHAVDADGKMRRRFAKRSLGLLCDSYRYGRSTIKPFLCATRCMRSAFPELAL
jgi:hypothetical protein